MDGLRYPVESLLELLSAGMTIEEILDDYPDLEREDILAALEFGGSRCGWWARGAARRGVKFLVDAQVPARLARFLNDAGHDAVHTSELPDGNRATDTWIARFGDGEGRVVVTKDRDFRDGDLLVNSPRQLLVVATGEHHQRGLDDDRRDNLEVVVAALGESDFVEIGSEALVVHRRRLDED